MGAGRDGDEPSIDSLIGAVASAPFVSPPLAEGTIVDGVFAIERRLGRGGMGVVYLARDRRLNRPVALKLHGEPGVASDESALHEAKVTAQLSHPHVVTVHQVGTYQGQLFIAMEYVDGGTLRGWLGEKPRHWSEVLDKFVQAGRGVAAAHDAGLVHRDFKADNVLVGKDGRVRVADFGIARAVGTTGVDAPSTVLRASSTLTTSRGGTRAGTPAYMSPEQRRGEAVDARSDQYSFCVALEEALAETGRVPRWLQRVIARGRELDAGRRWRSMHALLARIDRHRRRRRLAMVAVGAAVAVIAGSIVAWQALRMSGVRDSGRWTGYWGEFILRTEANGTARGVYQFDNGSVFGTIRDGVFRGWWCETPTRQPPKDAGEMEFWFIRDDQGPGIVGRWRYGTEGEWSDNWTQRWVSGDPDPSLAERLGDPAQFCPHP